MRLPILYFTLQIAIAMAMFTTDLDARDLTIDSYPRSLEARDLDNLVPDIHKRGLGSSKTGKGVPQKAPAKQGVPDPRLDKALEHGAARKSRTFKAPPELQKAERKIIAYPPSRGKMPRQPQTSLSSKTDKPSVYRRPAGGGTLGHSRIPPTVPKNYPSIDNMQIPSPSAEQMHGKSQSSRRSSNENDQFQPDKTQDAARSSKEHSTTWNPAEEAGKRRPPALTSIDDF